MKTYVKESFSLCLLLVVFTSPLVRRLQAETFQSLYSFTATRNDPSLNFNSSFTYTNGDGATPNGPLALWGNTLYGTAHSGGPGAAGTVFALATDGSGFTTLFNFTLETGDGNWPSAGLTLSSNALYGTAGHSFNGWDGTVFTINTDGTGFTTYYDFTGGSDGSHPLAALIFSGATLYGTTDFGGDSYNGVVFSINTDGTRLATLYSFTGPNALTVKNSDGAFPQAQLVLSGGTLYGMTEGGGPSGNGTLFALNIDGTGFTVLHTFTSLSNGTNIDGANTGKSVVTETPTGSPRLVLLGSTLYGTTEVGGSLGQGTVFALNTDGTGFTVLHSFAGSSDGATPSALALSGHTLFGSAANGGPNGTGTLFKLDTDGTSFAVLHTFSAPSGSASTYPHGSVNSDGVNPNSLAIAGSVLYGTTVSGGVAGHGTIFGLSLLPVTPAQLTITASGSGVVLTWPTNTTSFTLQSSTNLMSAIWTTNLPPPVLVNGQNTVTNPISGTQQFFRLSQ